MNSMNSRENSIKNERKFWLNILLVDLNTVREKELEKS